MFKLCRDLSIDDPVAWFDSVDAAVVDRWLAFYWVESEEATAGDKKEMTPDEMRSRLDSRFGR